MEEEVTDLSLSKFPVPESTQWLKSSLEKRLPNNLKHIADSLLDLHLDPMNFRMAAHQNFESTIKDLKDGKANSEIRKNIRFESTSDISGTCRILVKTHLNRTGIGFISRGMSRNDQLNNPRVLGIFPEGISKETLQSYCDYQKFVKTWIAFAEANRDKDFPENKFSFSDTDIISLKELLNFSPLVQRSKENLPPMIHDNWRKIVWGIYTGLIFLKNFCNFDQTEFTQRVLAASNKWQDIDFLLKATQSEIYQFGAALTGSFFADCGYKEFLKIDVHVRDSLQALVGENNLTDELCWKIVRRAAQESEFSPRAIDKIMYLSCSSKFYFYSPEALPGQALEKQAYLNSLKNNFLK